MRELKQPRTSGAALRPPWRTWQQGHAPADLNHYEQGRDATAPAMRVPIAEAAFCAVHAGDGGATIAGVDKEAFLHAAKMYCSASGPEKTGAICYALGWTQHSSGVQIIRTRRDFAVAARKYGAAGRRDFGVARACVDSGIDGCSNAVRHFAGISEHAAIWR